MNHPEREIISEIKNFSSIGMDFVDISYEWPSNIKFNTSEIRNVLKEIKLGLVGHSNPSLPAIYPLKAVRDAVYEELIKTVNFFKEVGADKVNIHPFYYAGFMNESDIIRENINLLNKLSHYCGEQEIDLMLENFIPPFHSPQIFQIILKEVPALKVHIDVAHLNFTGDLYLSLENFIDRFGKKIIHYHMHDNKGKKDDHLPLGCGNIDWGKVAKIIKKSGYDGTFTLEVFCSDCAYIKYSKEKWEKAWMDN